MAYDVKQPEHGHVLVTRTQSPRCTITFTREREGWSCIGLVWLDTPMPDDAAARAILDEAGVALVTERPSMPRRVAALA